MIPTEAIAPSPPKRTLASLAGALMRAKSTLVMVTTFFFGLASCVASLFIDPTQSGWSSFLLAIGTGLLASSLYSFFTGVIVQDEQTRALSVSIEEKLSEIADRDRAQIGILIEDLKQNAADEFGHIRELASATISDLGMTTQSEIGRLLDQAISSLERYRPDHDWPESDSPDADYNQKLDSSLRGCNVYYFQGITAQTSIARLASMPKNECPSSAFFLIADPTRPDTIVRREFRDDNVTGGIDQGARADELKRSVMVSIVGAHALRQRVPHVELVLMTEPPIDRAEILGNYAFISMFSMQRDRAKLYPPSAAFSSRTYVFQAHKEECITLVESRYMKRIVVPAHDDVAEFRSLLSELEIDLSDSEYNNYLDTFRERVAKVSATLHPRSQA